MDSVLKVIAQLIENAANAASASASFIGLYQPKKPDCFKKQNEEK